MGMDVAIDVVDDGVSISVFQKVFDYLREVDAKFSTYKKDSEISKLNDGLISLNDLSSEMQEVFDLSRETALQTNNFFNIKNRDGKYDPSGLVKGWAIHKAANILREHGCKNFMVDIGSDIEISGFNHHGVPWVIGIRNPFDPSREIVKVVHLSDRGIATSGKYAKGDHIYNPNDYTDTLDGLVSVTIIGKNVYEADRFATAVFAMGRHGVHFLEEQEGLEGYIIDKDGLATMTTGFHQYIR